MLPERIRVSVTLEKDCEPDVFLKMLEEVLGRPVQPIQRLKSVNLLSLRLTKPELETLRSLPGVLRAGPEERRELPPKPKRPGTARS